MANKIPEMKPVASSNIASIGYDVRAAELHVRFKNGGHYIYEGVPEAHHSDMLAAESVGKFLAERVKGNFTFRKHDPDAA